VSLENNEQVKSDDNQEHSAKVDNSRRSFAKRSAAIAPVIMTLANRSAWAGEFCSVNQSVTGLVSNAPALNSHTVVTPNSNWRTPAYWKDWLLPNTTYPGLNSTQTANAKQAFDTSTDNLNAYRFASRINNANSAGFPAMFLPNGYYYEASQNSVNPTRQQALAAYRLFYSNCAI
jgi:hypothetical protein